MMRVCTVADLLARPNIHILNIVSVNNHLTTILSLFLSPQFSLPSFRKLNTFFNEVNQKWLVNYMERTFVLYLYTHQVSEPTKNVVADQMYNPK